MRRFAMAVACTLFLFGLSGCGQEPEGPAEQIGKEIDQAFDTAAKKVEQAGDEVRRSTAD